MSQDRFARGRLLVLVHWVPHHGTGAFMLMRNQENGFSDLTIGMALNIYLLQEYVKMALWGHGGDKINIDPDRLQLGHCWS